MDNIEQKAKELVAKFYEIEDCNEHYSMQSDGRICAHIAKQCAIICIDEIIDFISEDPYYKDFDHWQKIKERLLAGQ